MHRASGEFAEENDIHITAMVGDTDWGMVFMLLEDLTPEWVPCSDHPGCYQKTMKRGNVTLICIRPILDPEEQKRREAVTIRTAENFLSAIERRKHLKALEN